MKEPTTVRQKFYAKSGLPVIPYVDEKWSVSKEQYSYYYVVRKKDRKRGCPVRSQSLKGGYEVARSMAAKFNEKRLSWELGAPVDTAATPLFGSWGWLVTNYTGERKFKNVADPYNREWHLKLVGKVSLADGTTIWDTSLDDITGRVAEKIYEVLLPTLKKDAEGNWTEAERKTVAVKCCHYARSAWNEMNRLEPHVVPDRNAFSNMGLSLESKEMPAADLEELADFIQAAEYLREPNLAAIARLAWDWCQRTTHAVRDFHVWDFRAPGTEQWAYVHHPKVKKRAVFMPLYSEEGQIIFPDLFERLVDIKGDREDGQMFFRDEHFRRTGEYVPWMSDDGDLRKFRRRVNEIMEEASLRRLHGMSSFRQGGINELAEMRLSETEIKHFTRQTSAATLMRYTKRTAHVIINIQKERLIHQVKPRLPDPLLRRVGTPEAKPLRITGSH
jgi:hypothetical protein